MEQEQEHVFVNAFLFLFPECSLSVHEHVKERRTLYIFITNCSRFVRCPLGLPSPPRQTVITRRVLDRGS